MDEVLPDGTPTRTAVPCKRCGGWLVSIESIARRLGPVCARHARAAVRRSDDVPLFEIEGVS